MQFRTGHRPDPPEVVARRKGFHILKAKRGLGVAPLPLKTNNRARMLPALGGPGILNQQDTGSCFPAGTPILMGDYTERPIEGVAEGNVVLTHNGKARSITKLLRRSYDGPLYTLRLKGHHSPLTMTAEHPVCVVGNTSPRAKYGGFEAGEILWVAAKDIQPRDYVLMPGRSTTEEETRAADTVDVAKYLEEDVWRYGDRVRVLTGRVGNTIPATFKADARFAQLMGMFLAEGSYRKNDGHIAGLTFTFARHEKAYQTFVVDALTAVFGVDATVVEQESRPSVSDVRCNNVTLAQLFFAMAGEHALAKRVPTVFYRSPRDVRIALLRGWMQGDGTQKVLHMRDRSAQITGTTSSETLHRGLYRLALLSGLKPGSSTRKQEEHQNAPARDLTFYSHDIAQVFPEHAITIAEAGIKPDGGTNYRRHDLGFLCRVKSIEVSAVDEPIDVYNLEVDGEHTYVANGVAVHNCEGHAHASGITLRFALLGTPIPIVSPVGVYDVARLISRTPNADGTVPALSDDGTEPNLVISGLSEWGACSAVTWGDYPASSATINDEPTPQDMMLAGDFKLDGAYFLTSTGDQYITDLMTALAAGYPCSDAIAASGSAFQGYTGGVLGPLDDAVDHANLIVDYEWDGSNLSSVVAYCVNSWSASWGEADVAGLAGGMYRANRDFLAKYSSSTCVLDVSAIGGGSEK
jgi:intein/homing endonuclease